jgi:predicted nucleic acid-binding Zn ribbon protein
VARTKDPKKISAIVVEMCHILGMEEARQQFRTLQIWNSVVGEAVASATSLDRFSDGQLFIRVKNPAWRMELNYRKQDIIIKLNDVLGQTIVKEIIFR